MPSAPLGMPQVVQTWLTGHKFRAVSLFRSLLTMSTERRKLGPIGCVTNAGVTNNPTRKMVQHSSHRSDTSPAVVIETLPRPVRCNSCVGARF